MKATAHKLATVAVVLALAAGCSGSGPDKAGGDEVSEEVVVLKLANMDTDPTNLDTPAFIEAVKRLSGGSIRIEQEHGWNADEPIEDVEERTIEDVRTGEADLAAIPARAWDLAGATSFQALGAPFLVDSYALQGRVLASPLAERMLAGLEPLGLVGVSLLPGGLRYPLGFSRELAGPADYAGATIGIRPSGIAEATFAALGARSKVFVPGEIEGLDGAELDPITIGTVRYDRAARALTGNVVLWPRAMTIAMNAERFAALTPEQQDILRRAGREVVEPHLARLQQEGAATMASLCSGLNVVSASAGELAALRTAVQPVYDELEQDDLTRELLEKIASMRGDVTAAVDEVEDCPGATGDGGAESYDSELEGRWEATLSVDEILEVDAHAAAEQIAGTTVLAFDDGEFRALDAATGEPGAAGTYKVDGDLVTIVWDYGIGIQPGQSDELRWSVYRDALTFSAVEGLAADLFAIKPWTRAD